MLRAYRGQERLSSHLLVLAGSAAVTVVNRVFESVLIDEQGLDPVLAVLRLPVGSRVNASRSPAA